MSKENMQETAILQGYFQGLDSPTHPWQASCQESSILPTHQLLLIITPDTCEKVFIKRLRGREGLSLLLACIFLVMSALSVTSLRFFDDEYR